VNIEHSTPPQPQWVDVSLTASAAHEDSSVELDCYPVAGSPTPEIPSIATGRESLAQIRPIAREQTCPNARDRQDCAKLHNPASSYSNLEISIPGEFSNPLPLRPRQLWALLVAAIREMLWGLRAVSREIEPWRSRATTIPDASIREDALNALAKKRAHTDGAALFWILPRQRKPHLLRLLVDYQIAWDFLDNVSERGAPAGAANSSSLYTALSDALELGGAVRDYYRFHPWSDDGGYLAALVNACRLGCERLPAYEDVRALLRRETRRALVLGINHDLDPEGRDVTLKGWAEREYADQAQASWFELTSAASASLTVHAILALAAESGCGSGEVESAYSAYFPWISALGTMLDSYVDQAEDVAIGNHVYIEHYANGEVGLRRVGELVGRSAREARGLANGHRHAVIVACMVAMYLSKDSARVPAMRASTRGLVHAGGSLAVLLLPVLRVWRIAYAQRSV
jgi:tetraprenyl-beta-curcumene synthase